MKRSLSAKKSLLCYLLVVILASLIIYKPVTYAKETYVKFNKTYKAKLTYDLLDDKVSGTYSLKISKVKSIKKSQYEKYRIKADDKLNYKLLKITVKVKNVKIKKVNGEGTVYKSMLFDGLSFWGTMTSKGDYVIGSTDYGFDGCLDDAIHDKVGFVKLKAGKSFSATVTGYVVVGVFKNQTSYFIATNPTIDDYNDSKIHFKLK